MNKKLVVYVDMDDCLCDYNGAYTTYKSKHPSTPFPQSISGFFLSLKPLPGAIESIHWLASIEYLDVYILSAPSILNPLCYTEKRLWVEQNLGFEFVNRLILSPHKHLNVGDYLIDNNTSGKGQELFQGKLVHFGSDTFPNWASVRAYFEQVIAKAKNRRPLHARK